MTLQGNDFEDVEPDFHLEIPITAENRLQAVCMDQHHCTIANAIHDFGAAVGIVELARRGVSKTMVSVRLDPKIHKGYRADRTYRARLTRHSAEVVAELDAYYGKDKEHKRFKDYLRKIVGTHPDGTAVAYETITLVAPKPSQRKGYKRGKSGTNKRQPRTDIKSRSGLPHRQYNGAPRPTKVAA